MAGTASTTLPIQNEIGGSVPEVESLSPNINSG